MFFQADDSVRLGNPRAADAAFRVVVSRLVLRTVSVGAALATVLVGGFHLYLGTGAPTTWPFLIATLGLAFWSWRESQKAHPPVILPLVAMLVLLMARLVTADPFVAVALLVPLSAIGLMGTFSLSDRHLRFFSWALFGSAGVAAVSYAIRFEPVGEVWRGIVSAAVGLGLSTILVVLLRRENRRFIAGYENLYDAVSVGLVRISVDGHLVAANRRMTEMLGYDRTDLEVGDVRSIVFDEADLARAIDVVRSGEPGELRLRHSNGEPVWVRLAFEPISSGEGELLGYEGFVEDLTESRRAKADANQAEARFATVFDSAPIGMALVDESGTVVRANQAFSELAGSAEPLDGGVPLTSILDGQLGNPSRLFDPHWSEDEQSLRVTTATGGRAHVRVHVAHLQEPDPATDFAIVQLLDVTSHVELASLLRRQVEAKNDFIATVSHELRTPLTAVIGFLDEFPEVVGDLAEEPGEMLDIISTEANSLGSIVEDLLVAARADIDQLVVRTETVQIAEIVDRVVRAASRIARDHETSVTTADVQQAAAQGDTGRVEQILWNLLTNALRHGGDEISVGAEQRADRVVIWVRDNGAGIPSEVADRLFEPFQSFAGGNGVTTSMGLGLHVAQKLARLMGGSIHAGSDSDGAEFVVDLPAATSAAVPG